MINKITSTEIEVRLAGHFNYRQNLIVPNISWGMDIHECDLLIVRKSGVGIEVEIKVDKYDLIKDAKKPHHHKDRSNRIKELYFAIPDYLEKYIEYIPERAGILVLTKHIDSSIYINCRELRKPVPNKTARKFTVAEMMNVARLGTMRIWSLKRTIISNKWREKKQHIKPAKELIEEPILF
jgi:hypothetical protein